MNFHKEYRPGLIDENRYHHRIEIRDGNGLFLGDLDDYEDLEWVANADSDDVEASQLTVAGSSKWAKTLMRANMRILLVHILLYRGDKMVKLWTGRVDRSVRSREGSQSSIKVELISDKGWFGYLHFWSAPFAALWVQIPKKRIKTGPAIFIMKQFLIDNLLRLQSSASISQKARLSLYHENPSTWSTIQQHMYPLMVVPTPYEQDGSPTSVLTIRMNSAAEAMTDLCKDFNLLPTATFHVPGRDPAPPNVIMTRPGVVIDIVDKDKSRTGHGPPSLWQQISSILSPFFKGMFGRYDVPPVLDTSNIDDLKGYFGGETEPWVIFRESPKHWSSTEVAAYAPTTSSSIAGGKSHDFLNKGITLLANSAIQFAFSMIGLGFIGNLITGELDDLFFAYQKADDNNLREVLGDFTFFENYDGQGTTAYSMDSAQALRSMRYAAIGYKTATFSGGAESMPPFRPFEDFDILDPLAWEDRDEDRIIPERLKQIKVTESRSEGVSFSFSLGEIERPEDPWSIQQRRNDRFKQAIDAAFMAD